MSTSTLQLLIVAIAILLAGCNSEKKAWESTQKLDAIPAYKEHLAKYPTGPHAGVARERIDDLTRLEWEKAQSKNTIEGFQAFLNLQPPAKYVELATEGIGQLRLDAAQRADTVEAYEQFLGSEPPNRLKKEAINRLLRLFNRTSFSAICDRDFANAEAILRKATELDPSDPLALNNLALLLARKGELDVAKKYFEAAKQSARQLEVNNVAFWAVANYKSGIVSLHAFQAASSNSCKGWERYAASKGNYALIAGEGIPTVLTTFRQETKEGGAPALSGESAIEINLAQLAKAEARTSAR